MVHGIEQEEEEDLRFVGVDRRRCPETRYEMIYLWVIEDSACVPKSKLASCG